MKLSCKLLFAFVFLCVCMNVFSQKNSHAKFESELRECFDSIEPFFKQNDYSTIISKIPNLLNLIDKVYGKQSVIYTETLSILAESHFKLNNYTEAINYEKNALSIRKTILDEKHPNYILSLETLALYYSSLENYPQAIKFETEALIIKKSNLGEMHPDYLLSLEKLSSYYEAVRDFPEAIKFETEILSINEVKHGKIHVDYAKSLDKIASYNSNIGNYSEVVRLGTKALAIKKVVFGEMTLEYAYTLHLLADGYASIGNYTEAIKLITEALTIKKYILGEMSHDYALSLGNLAIYNSFANNDTEALRLLNQMLEILENTITRTHPDYASTLHNIAIFYYDKENYVEAIELEKKAIRIRKEIQGEIHPDYAKSLLVLAACNAKIGNNSEAVELGMEALSIEKEVLGERHPHYATTLRYLATYNSECGQSDKAAELLVNYYSNILFNLLKTFHSLTTYERTKYWEKEKNTFTELFLEQYFKYKNKSLLGLSYNSILVSKNILLNTEMEFSRMIAESGDNEISNLYSEFLLNRRFINRLYGMPIKNRPLDADSLEKATELIEQKLIQKSKAYGDFTHNLAINWKSVQEKLSENDIAIEMIAFPVDNDSTMYCALTIKKGYETPKMIPLFEAKQLAKIHPRRYYTSNVISNLVWKPLQEELSGVKNVYFAPDGELYNIAIESLKHYNGEGFMFDEWNFYRLSSTRELVKIRADKNSSNVILYGGLDYNANISDLVLYPSNDDNLYYNSTRSMLDSIGLRAGFAPLENTLPEVKQIDSLYSAINVPSKLYMGQNGTEYSFKQLSGKKFSNLHIATHGFYWNESDLNSHIDLKNLSFISIEDKPKFVEDKAMTRSGLLFSGANKVLSHHDSIPEGYEDGILTAQEISTLDFRGLDLLVLSACQTGLGEIKGDGVFGLQRGFKKAGVQTIMMTLWEVDDVATQMLMTEFYKGLTGGLLKQEAFLKAQKMVRDYKGKIDGVYKDFSNPRYWAAFIMLDGI